MDVEMNWNDEVEATDSELIAALEREILQGKEILNRLSADEELVF